ncbi:hypothetical protein P3S67_008497 [Capsicum chacoense]
MTNIPVNIGAIIRSLMRKAGLHKRSHFSFDNLLIGILRKEGIEEEPADQKLPHNPKKVDLTKVKDAESMHGINLTTAERHARDESFFRHLYGMTRFTMMSGGRVPTAAELQHILYEIRHPNQLGSIFDSDRLHSYESYIFGVTNTLCESKRKMKAPSLVARLMGLESMPAGSGSKPQKGSASETWSYVAKKLGARLGGSDNKDMDFEMAEIKSSEPGLQRFRDKCALTYLTRYFSPLEDEEDLVRYSLDPHSTDSYPSSSPKSSTKDKVLVESVDSVDDEPLFPEPDRDLSDGETSLSTRKSCRELIHNVSGVLSKID